MVIDQAVEATCTNAGLTEGKHCSRCDEVLVIQELISLKEHSWDDGVQTLDPSCIEKGEKTYTCTVCNERKVEKIDALGHDYIASGEFIEATCFKGGTGTKTCSRCNDQIVGSSNPLGHDYKDGYCTGCGIPYIKYLVDTFGDNVDLYTNGEENPYNIDLDKYGSNVLVMFYDPDLSVDPYEGTSYNKNNFYTSTYTIANTYEEAYFRTQHKLLSGSIEESGLNYYPSQSSSTKENSLYNKYSTAVYILSTDGDYIAYIPNSNNMDRAIFYGAGYVTMNDVAAYLLAFGEVPANSKYKSSDKSASISDWGKYGRCNNTQFSGNINNYPYEPELPYILSNSTRFVGEKRTYYETDFGALGGFTSESGAINTDYNTGSSINRNVCRFVFVCDSDIKSIDDRYVFYTYNHYNDFQEYLNHDDAWGLRFGNCTGGGTYNSKTDYNPTQYPYLNYIDEYSEFTKSTYHKDVTIESGEGGDDPTPVIVDPVNPSDSLKATMSYSSTSTTNMVENTDSADKVNLDTTIFNVYGTKGGNANNIGLNKAGTIRLYASNGNGNTLTIEVEDGYIIDSITINLDSTVSSFTLNDTSSYNPTSNQVIEVNINKTLVEIQNTGTAQLHIKSIEIEYHEA